MSPPQGRKKVNTGGLKIKKDSTTAAIAGIKTPTSPNPAHDMHPYARGAVIEVWHIPPKPQNHHHHKGSVDEWWWSSEEEEEEEEDGEEGQGEEEAEAEKGTEDSKDPTTTSSNSCAMEGASAATTSASTDDSKSKNEKENTPTTKSIRLCDIIDRTQVTLDAYTPNERQEWRYYVHYRDFNRRMDEWITIDRIVSPPSVGNSKARLLRKEEEKRKKMQEKLKAAAAVVDLSAPRHRRQREEEGGSGMRQRRQRRRKVVSTPDPEDMDTSTTPPPDAHGLPVDSDDPSYTAQDPNDSSTVATKQSNAATKRDHLALPTDSVTTHTVGEGNNIIVATLNATEIDEHEGLDEQSLREHEEVTKVKNVNFLELGAYQMETWYYSPLPKDLIGLAGVLDVLYVCEFTLHLFARKRELLRFQERLAVQDRHPPGDEIYRKGKLAMFEVDAQQEEVYCQNLSYIAKLFLDHKTLYFSVSPFLFYVLCEVDDRGYHPVGYYSKEKYSDVGYNLACILTFPAHQRKGYGRFLIAFSYELSKKEEKVGSPEKPMSDLGQQAYKPYWTSTIVKFLLHQSTETSMSIMVSTGSSPIGT